MNKNKFDVIIVGGSYSGMAAGMALGRAMKKVLIIDNGKPCNKQTPHSHNFLTNDGRTPAEIASMAKSQVRNYETISFLTGTAIRVNRIHQNFLLELATGEIFSSRKLVFATGIKDLLPPIEGLAECWGITVLHCPYCHGFEIRNEKTGILGNGDQGFEFAKLISNWTKDLTLFTNGISTLSQAQFEILTEHKIDIVEKVITRLEHIKGHLRQIQFNDGSNFSLKALYAPTQFEQHCKIPETLGCELTEEGYLKIDSSYETTVKGVFAIGDNSSKMRTVANAISMGTSAGLLMSKKMIVEGF